MLDVGKFATIVERMSGDPDDPEEMLRDEFGITYRSLPEAQNALAQQFDCRKLDSRQRQVVFANLWSVRRIPPIGG